MPKPRPTQPPPPILPPPLPRTHQQLPRRPNRSAIPPPNAISAIAIMCEITRRLHRKRGFFVARSTLPTADAGMVDDEGFVEVVVVVVCLVVVFLGTGC